MYSNIGLSFRWTLPLKNFIFIWFYMYMYKNALMFLHPLGSFVVPLISQAGYNTSYIYTHTERRVGRGGEVG